MTTRADAVERVAPRAAGGRRPGVVLSCEHASERLPAGFAWPAEDARLRGTHWSHDLGAAALTRALAAALDAPAVLARFSRLLVDPNRPLSSDTLFRREADGAAVRLNEGIDAAQRATRLAYWRHYHDALAEAAAGRAGEVLLAVHSFTPVYEGTQRALEIGVLFDREEALAQRLARRLAALGLAVRLNEPYSGKEGLIYSAQHHADRSGMRAVEIEVRQDLLAERAFLYRLVACLARTPW